MKPVSASPLSPSVKVKLLNAGFLTSEELLQLKPLQLSKGNHLYIMSITHLHIQVVLWRLIVW